MTRYALVFTALIICVTGCAETVVYNPTLPDLDSETLDYIPLQISSPRGTLEAFDATKDTVAMTFQTSIRKVSPANIHYTLLFERLLDSGMFYGTRTTLKSTNGGLLWRLQYEATDEDSTIMITEQTTSDSLAIIRTQLSGGLFRERYILNAEEIWDVTFDPDDSVPDSVATAFMASFPEGCTLFDNQYGDMLIATVSDDEFVSWIADALGLSPGNGKTSVGAGSMRPLRNTYVEVCAIAGLTCTFKCIFGGGLMNPLCIAACGIDLACNIANLFCAFCGCCG